MKIVFCGTPQFAVPTLKHLLTQPEFEIAAVITQPDRPSGRGMKVTASPVKEAALAAGVACDCDSARAHDDTGAVATIKMEMQSAKTSAKFRFMVPPTEKKMTLVYIRELAAEETAASN